MKKTLLYIWQLPQNIIGFIVSWGAKKEDGIYYRKLFRSGVSLGDYIIFDSMIKLFPESWQLVSIKHERGHQKQSQMLGPLYLLVIGLPSLIGNLLSRLFHWSAEKYYKQPWEAWADKLGGVKRP